MIDNGNWRVSVFGDEIADALEDQLAVMSRLGVRHLELRTAWGTNVVELGPPELERARRLLEQAGVTVSAVGSPVGKAPVEGPLDAELDRLDRALDAAERLGTGLVRVFSFFISDGRYEAHRDEVLRRMAAMAGRAERRGLTLVLENESHVYGDSAARCLEILDGTGSEALRMAFDPANFVQVGQEPLEAWSRLRPHVAHFHVKDAVAVDREGAPPYPAPAPEGRLGDSVRPAGEGLGRLPELLDGLRAIDYRGFLTIEPHLARRLPDLDGSGRFEVALSALRGLLKPTPLGG